MCDDALLRRKTSRYQNNEQRIATRLYVQIANCNFCLGNRRSVRACSCVVLLKSSSGMSVGLWVTACALVATALTLAPVRDLLTEDISLLWDCAKATGDLRVGRRSDLPKFRALPLPAAAQFDCSICTICITYTVRIMTPRFHA